MQAIQGIYNNGSVEFINKPPKKRSNVIVVFTDELPDDDDEKMSTEEALRIFHKHAGTIKGDLDAKAERLAYLDERYGGVG